MKSKMWSDTSNITMLKRVRKLIINEKDSIRVDVKMFSNPTRLKGKRILLVDDTIATGTTILHCSNYLLEKCYAKTVHSFVLYTSNTEYCNYYSAASKVPLFWPWGYELN